MPSRDVFRSIVGSTEVEIQQKSTANDQKEPPDSGTLEEATATLQRIGTPVGFTENFTASRVKMGPAGMESPDSGVESTDSTVFKGQQQLQWQPQQGKTVVLIPEEQQNAELIIVTADMNAPTSNQALVTKSSAYDSLQGKQQTMLGVCLCCFLCFVLPCRGWAIFPTVPPVFCSVLLSSTHP